MRIAVDGAVSPVRLFVPGPEPAVPSLVSPLRGLVTHRPHGVRRADVPHRGRVRGEADDTDRKAFLRAGVYTAPTPGYAVFRLNAADFPDARSIVVSAKLPPVNYRIEQTAGCRIARRSAEGSIEHYTFPRSGGAASAPRGGEDRRRIPHRADPRRTRDRAPVGLRAGARAPDARRDHGVAGRVACGGGSVRARGGAGRRVGGSASAGRCGVWNS